MGPSVAEERRLNFLIPGCGLQCYNIASESASGLRQRSPGRAQSFERTIGHDDSLRILLQAVARALP